MVAFAGLASATVGSMLFKKQVCVLEGGFNKTRKTPLSPQETEPTRKRKLTDQEKAARSEACEAVKAAKSALRAAEKRHWRAAKANELLRRAG